MRVLAFPLALLLALLPALAGPARAGEDLAALVERLASEEPNAAYEAYRALPVERGPQALALLEQVLPRCPRTGQSYGWSYLLGYPPADLSRVARRFAAQAPPYLRASAGAWLMRQGEPKAVGAILAALAGAREDPVDLAWALGQLHGLKDPALQAAVRDLVRPEAPPLVLGAALTHLQGVGDAQAQAPAAALLEGGPGPRAIGAAFLWRMGEEDRAAALAQALASGEVSFDAFVRVQAILAGAGRLPEAVMEAVRGLLLEPPSDYALVTLVRFVGEHPDPRAVPALKALLDRDDATGQAAFEALAAIPGAFGPQDVRALLEGGTEARRVAAADALRRGDDLSGLDAVVEVLRRGTSARAEAARVLGGFRVRAAVAPLLDALLDADATVRANAQTSLAGVLSSLFPYRRIDLAGVGYASTADVPTREAAVGRLRAWWKAREGGAW